MDNFSKNHAKSVVYLKLEMMSDIYYNSNSGPLTTCVEKHITIVYFCSQLEWIETQFK